MDKASILSNVGVEKGITYEVIVTTVSSEGRPNAAPMGIRTLDGETITLLLYKSTQTYRNIVATGKAVANVTDDPQLFYETALKEAAPPPLEILMETRFAEVPRLANAEGFIVLIVTAIGDGEMERSRVDCNPVYYEVSKLRPKPYCRGRFAAIEAIVHATRVKFYFEVGRRAEASRLIQSIAACKSLVERVSPDSGYSRVVENVLSKVREWERGG